ncbi:MAG TPA: inositol monophosphatase [Acidimicrobiales bacterium]|nr:inositol monophosphatase [Acidimicrobiales bacterium]
MDTAALMEVMDEVADRVRAALDGLGDWGPSGERPGQYRSDVVADAAAVEVLTGNGIGVLSEESGRSADGPTGLLAVLDPVDGSTNAARGIPWFATSVCVVDSDGPVAALVANQASGVRYRAVRGEPPTRDGQPISPRSTTELGRSVLGLAGYPPRYLGWRQYRALGAAALDLCGVADGTLDGYLDCSAAGHGPWDYLGGLLVCEGAGATVADARGRELAVVEHTARRTPVAGATPELLEALLVAWHRAIGN